MNTVRIIFIFTYLYPLAMGGSMYAPQWIGRKYQRYQATRVLEVMSEEQMTSLLSPRIFNMRIQKTKIILIHRNTKDAAVPLYNHHLYLTGLYKYKS